MQYNAIFLFTLIACVVQICWTCWFVEIILLSNVCAYVLDTTTIIFVFSLPSTQCKHSTGNILWEVSRTKLMLGSFSHEQDLPLTSPMLRSRDENWDYSITTEPTLLQFADKDHSRWLVLGSCWAKYLFFTCYPSSLSFETFYYQPRQT